MSRAAALARSTFALSEFLSSVFFPVVLLFTPPKPRPPYAWCFARPPFGRSRCRLVEKEKTLYKDESCSFDIGNVPVLIAPSLLTLYPMIPNTRCPLRHRSIRMISCSFFLLHHLSFMSHTSGPGLLSSLYRPQVHASVLVYPSCGLPGPPNKMRCSLRTSARDAWRHGPHTRTSRRETKKKEAKHPDDQTHTPTHCCLRAATYWKPDYGPDKWGMALIRLLPTLTDEYPLRPNYLCFGENGEDLSSFADC